MTSGTSDTVQTRRLVYIAAPPSLAAERQAAGAAIFAGGPAGGRFAVEELQPGVTPRAMAERAIRNCEFFLLILSDHWREARHGREPDWADVEEEFELAWACLEAEELPMAGIGVLFRRVDEEALKAPSFQLQQVQLFRRHIERTGRAFVGEFDQLADLTLVTKQCLKMWETVLPRPGAGGANAATRWGDSAAPVQREDLVGEAMRLADAGRIAGAEACFALAVSRGDDIAAHVAYGRFLRRLGRLTQALEVLEKAIEYAEGTRGSVALEQMALALSHAAQIHLSLGNTDLAESFNRRAAQLAADQQDAKGEAAAISNQGAMSKARGDLAEAAAAYKKALAIEERLNNESGIANQLCNLGLISRRRGDLDHAEMMLKKALAIDERLGRLEAMANGYGNLGLIMRARGELEQADASIRRAMALNEAIGRIEGLANDYFNLGDIERERGNLEQAERLHLISLGIEQRLGRVEGIARSMEALAIIDIARGRPGEARQRLSTAMQTFSRGGMKGDASRVARRLKELGM